MEDLCACLDCTDRDVFSTATNSLDECTEVVTSSVSMRTAEFHQAPFTTSNLVYSRAQTAKVGKGGSV